MEPRYQIPRKQLAVPGSSSSPGLGPVRPQLRPSRSTTYLREHHQNHQHHQYQQNPHHQEDYLHHEPQYGGIIDLQSGQTLQSEFHVDNVPSPGSLAPTPNHDIRRVKSSSALSAATTGDLGSKNPSPWKTALGEAQYFAGGLIARPAESTKHFTIIRHSHALVWYRGLSTSVSITILSDEPLPANRTVWLQEKGYSGNMGMNIKALTGSKTNWIDVTPATQAGLEHISEADERGVQRDLKRFEKKATGRLIAHLPRETHVVRIPAAAADGYFRLVVCAGKEGKKEKIICGSPVFRVASTSTDVSVVRGASLSTMPLEIGVKVATTIGQQVVQKYTGVLGAVVQSRTKKVVVNAAVKRAGQTAYRGYQGAGVGAAVSDSWEKNRAGRYDPMMSNAAEMGVAISIIGSDAGPETPFPLKFDGKVVRGTGQSTAELGVPTANLSEVSQDIKVRLNGVFAAWARVLPRAGMVEEVLHDWQEAIVTIAPKWNEAPSVAVKNGVVVHFINDLDGASFFDTRVKVLLMGYLRPPMGMEVEAAQRVDVYAQDAMITVASLGREAWAPDETVSKMKGLRSEKSFSEKLDGVTARVQQHVDRIPLHWAGVRSESIAMRDAVHGKGGLWIVR